MLTDRSAFACEEDCRFVGTAAALITSAIIAAGASAAEAKIQSKQTSKAVDAQTGATNQAIAGLKPFQNTGTQAFQTLGQLMGLAGGGGQAAQSPMMPLSNQATGSAAPAGMKQGAISDPSANHGYAAQAPGGGGLLPGGQGTFQTSQSASSYPSYAPHSSPTSMTKVKSPQGQVYDVPSDQVTAALQNGGTVVNG